MTDMLESKLNLYRELLARRRLSSLWQAERNGVGVAFGEGGEESCLALLADACQRTGIPCEGEVCLDGLSDLEMALVCDCFGDESFGADLTPRLASFQYMRRFLFGRMCNHSPSKVGFSEAAVRRINDERGKVLEDDDAPTFGMGRELMGEEFTENELDFLLQKGSRQILNALCEDGTLEEAKYARHVADAYWGDFISPRGFNFADYVEGECAAGKGDEWLTILLSGFRNNGATVGNPLAWNWDASCFCCHDGYQCHGLDEAPSGNPEMERKFKRIGVDETFVDADGISRTECLKAFAAYREICLRCVGLADKTASSAKSVFSSRYLVIDLSSGCKSRSYPIVGLDEEPKDGWQDEYKTTKLVLRRIEAGKFMMGSPSNEVGRLGDEVQREITISRPYYIGVFELTQKQWELVMGKKPSQRAGAMHPVESVSYEDIRGKSQGDRWPKSDAVDLDSFMGRLRARTGLDALDLPTEAEWEYAARAGVATSLTTGEDISSVQMDSHLSEVGRYIGNKGAETHAVVGSYKPNAWGIYDVQGNVFEWCLDRHGGVSGRAETDPKGPENGDLRVQRSGAWMFTASSCRLANRVGKNKSKSNGTMGLRVACH